MDKSAANANDNETNGKASKKSVLFTVVEQDQSLEEEEEQTTPTKKTATDKSSEGLDDGLIKMQGFYLMNDEPQIDDRHIQAKTNLNKAQSGNKKISSL